MNYTVVWQPLAESQLAALWIRAADRQAINAAAEGVDRLLRVSPAEQGESRGPAARILFLRPLCALFRVDEPARTVYVAAVKWVGR